MRMATLRGMNARGILLVSVLALSAVVVGCYDSTAQRGSRVDSYNTLKNDPRASDADSSASTDPGVSNATDKGRAGQHKMNGSPNR